MWEYNAGTSREQPVRRLLFFLVFATWAAAAPLQANAQGFAAGQSAWQDSRPIQAEQVWRKSGWQRDDYRSQFKLGQLYGDPSDKEYYDPVEAYVWYYLTTINKAGGGLSPISENSRKRIMAKARKQRRYIFDNLLTPEQWIEGQKRVIYILACRGADGLLTLGQLYDERLLMVKARGLKRQMEPPDRSILVPNKRTAILFYTLALHANHPDAAAHLRAIGKLPPPNDVVAAAERWMRPFELYPGLDYPGRRYRDYCLMSAEARKALSRAEEIDLKYVQKALTELGFYTGRIDGAMGKATEKAIERFETRIERTPTGHLTPGLAVQIIQTAAILGLADAQNRLGVMYFKGIGVEESRVRAHYWFKKAAAQNYPAALYHLGIIYQAGVRGVPKDPTKAEYYFARSAFAGFKKSQAEIEIRLHSSSKKRRPKSRAIDPKYGN